MKMRKAHEEAKIASPHAQSIVETDLADLIARPYAPTPPGTKRADLIAYCEAALEGPTPWDPFDAATPEGQARAANIARR